MDAEIEIGSGGMIGSPYDQRIGSGTMMAATGNVELTDDVDDDDDDEGDDDDEDEEDEDDNKEDLTVFTYKVFTYKAC